MWVFSRKQNKVRYKYNIDIYTPTHILWTSTKKHILSKIQGEKFLFLSLIVWVANSVAHKGNIEGRWLDIKWLGRFLFILTRSHITTGKVDERSNHRRTYSSKQNSETLKTEHGLKM
ncbi:hypothetical protein GCM10011502_26740 [Oceanisphaera marina]|uniref:Uncharacterized protein n=1 Tax=Oceanisphaera marina TaxID=2017550 RepID=A0ABQ1ITQ4_9GAMM|nr:hypothetical protein GCM10011502_26740 [Oceanisphaera marina]